jgi:hypothetical protein
LENRNIWPDPKAVDYYDSGYRFNSFSDSDSDSDSESDVPYTLAPVQRRRKAQAYAAITAAGAAPAPAPAPGSSPFSVSGEVEGSRPQAIDLLSGEADADDLISDRNKFLIASASGLLIGSMVAAGFLLGGVGVMAAVVGAVASVALTSLTGGLLVGVLVGLCMFSCLKGCDKQKPCVSASLPNSKNVNVKNFDSDGRRRGKYVLVQIATENSNGSFNSQSRKNTPR